MECRLRGTLRPTGCHRLRSWTMTHSLALRIRSTCSRVRKTVLRRPMRNGCTCRRWACTTSASSSTASDTVRSFLNSDSTLHCHFDRLFILPFFLSPPLPFHFLLFFSPLFPYQTNRLAWGNISEMTCFLSCGM